MKGPVLSVETAIGGGGIALLSVEAEDPIASRSNVAKADTLLLEIDNVLRRSGLTPDDLGSIAVSLGPGSFTGIKVGISTALGLAASLKIKCVGVTATEAMLERSLAITETICALPVGRNLVCTQRFDSEQIEVSKPRLSSKDEFVKAIERVPQVIAHHQVIMEIDVSHIENVVDIGDDLAVLIGRRALKTGTSNLSPVFTSDR